MLSSPLDGVDAGPAPNGPPFKERGTHRQVTVERLHRLVALLDRLDDARQQEGLRLLMRVVHWGASKRARSRCRKAMELLTPVYERVEASWVDEGG
jgi:hypothetical protein